MVAQDATEFQDLLRLQTAFAAQVVLDDPPGDFALIGAVAQSFPNNVVFSPAILVDASMNVIEESIANAKITMPYIAGMLFFREGPAAIRTASCPTLFNKPHIIRATAFSSHQSAAS